ncbi:MAG: hypothetical protein E7336_09485 [Clostridiales bacterium]|nr:hypothetical protein [Clostridiales bacterium]
MDKSKWNESIEKNLSGLQMTPAQRNRIRERIQEGEKMKRKMPLALVLALVLILVSFTAVALSNWDQIKEYLQTVRYISYEMMDWWALEDQMKLVEAMHTAGLEMDEDEYQRLKNEDITDEEKEKICGQIISARYGEDWKTIDIEAFEWPMEMRKESVDAMREYDQWSDQVWDEWEEEHPYVDPTLTEPLAQEGIQKIFIEKLTKYWSFAQESIDFARISIQWHPEEEIYEATYVIDADHPGKYQPVGSDSEKTMLQYMAETYGESESYPFRLCTDVCGNEISFSCLPMEMEMIRHLSSRLTEVKNFDYGSFDESLFEIKFLEDYQLWEGRYTITEENPGLFSLTMDEIEDGIEQITVLEYMRREEGNKESFTFACYYDVFGRYQPIDTPLEYEEHQAYEKEREVVQSAIEAGISKEEAEKIALEALVKKYRISDQELSELRPGTVLYTDKDGSYEYYTEFLGYEYTENLARIWSYAARVGVEKGEVRAAVSWDDWDQRTGRRLIPDEEDLAVGGMIWAHDMMDELRRVAGDDSGSGWKLCYNEEEKYFYDWSLEEKAALSQSMKPKIDAFLAANPEYAKYLEERGECPQYYNITRNTYGLPDDRAIAQNEAQKIAHDAILSQLKAEQAYLDGAGKINVYYDVTDPERPLWKFFFNTINLAVYPEDSWGYFVSLDAYTGEIVKIYPREVGMDMIDLM